MNVMAAGKSEVMLTYVRLRRVVFSLIVSCLLIMYYLYWKREIWSNDRYDETVFYRPPPLLEVGVNRLKINRHFRKQSSIKKAKKTNLMIISQGRSGSSFIGQIFNRHPNVFYIYEPLHTLERVDGFDTFIGNNTEVYNRRASLILGEIFNCSFRKSPYLDYLSRPGHFRLSSRVLKSPPFCTKDAKEKTAKEVTENQMCTYLEPKALNKVCKMYRATVIKVLEHRVLGRRIKSLKHILEIKEFDNKILYLVRDPRAVLWSMYHAGWIASVRQDGHVIPYQPMSNRFHWYVKRICGQLETNVMFVKNPPFWSRERILLLRYEDLINDTENVIRKMLEFIGLETQPGMKQWLYEQMHERNYTLGGREGEYSTKKNSSLALNGWRLQASLEMVQVIEAHCKTVMDSLGYILTNGSKTLQYHLGLPLVNDKHLTSISYGMV